MQRTASVAGLTVQRSSATSGLRRSRNCERRLAGMNRLKAKTDATPNLREDDR